MEATQPANRRQWRALVKKLRRKKIRQKAAREREKKLQQEEEAKNHDPAYQEWLKLHTEMEEFQHQAEQRQQQYEEEMWLRRERIAQQQFQLDRQREMAEEAVREAELLKKEKEFEEAQELQRKKREEKQQSIKEAATEFERLLQRMEEFLADPEMEILPELRRFAETLPGRDVCQIYERTNNCRFGVPCVYNHRRPMLSRILLIRHFFSHPQLEQVDQLEYGNDVLLEFSEGDIQAAYAEFFADVVPELEGFGTIVNVRTVSNTQLHLRGHVFVEYTSERAALNAFIKLQGRYYAKKRLNVEFSNIVVWRTAICGLAFIRKCPQGRNCLYLHLYRNPGNRYNTILEVTKKGKAATARLAPTPLISWNDLGKTPSTPQNECDKPRNWRWSESPEIELKSTTSNYTKTGTESRKISSKLEKQDSRSHSRASDNNSHDRNGSNERLGVKKHKSNRRSRSRSRSRSSERPSRHSRKNSNDSNRSRKRSRSRSSKRT